MDVATSVDQDESPEADQCETDVGGRTGRSRSCGRKCDRCRHGRCRWYIGGGCRGEYRDGGGRRCDRGRGRGRCDRRGRCRNGGVGQRDRCGLIGCDCVHRTSRHERCSPLGDGRLGDGVLARGGAAAVRRHEQASDRADAAGRWDREHEIVPTDQPGGAVRRTDRHCPLR
jgi:hypothetical protein